MLQVNGLSLAGEVWEPANLNAVCLVFLKAEWYKHPDNSRGQYSNLLESPALGDANEDQIRSWLLAKTRDPLLWYIPSSTDWFMVKHLRRRHFTELHVINHSDWTSSADRNELLKVSRRRPEPLYGPSTSWASPILWGHSKAGPFTILEGNHRLTALAGSTDSPEMPLIVYIGLSKSMCHWRLLDHE
jgi:hypothetical protein